ncbi:MAG: heme NO-binding domain-containing protein [Deltaproteobacteria bacterium]|nr:heme NO-binding domain-containing protein [Deltaproteobacteria bacterium]
MVGLIQQLLFDFVAKNWGDDAVKEVRKRAGVAEDVKYRMDQAYSDDEWQRLVGAAVGLSGLDPVEAETAFARFCGEELHKRMSGFFQGCTCAHDLLRRQPTIHNTMSASVRDAATRDSIAAKFRLVDSESSTVIHYKSPNRHCVLYRGLAHWVAEHFGEKIEIQEPRCMKRGDDECEIHVKYLGKA